MAHARYVAGIILLVVTAFVLPAHGFSVSGNVTGVWDDAVGDTVKVIGNITVPDKETLTIKSGIVVCFEANYQMVVEGHLEVQGSENAPVIFEPAYEDEFWRGIQIFGASSSMISMRWFVIRRAQFAVDIIQSSALLAFGRIEESLFAGIIAQNNSDVNVNSCHIHVELGDNPTSYAPLYVSNSSLDFYRSVVDFEIALPSTAPLRHMSGIFYENASGTIDSSHVEVETNRSATGVQIVGGEGQRVDLETSSVHVRTTQSGYGVKLNMVNPFTVDHLSIELESLASIPDSTMYGIYAYRQSDISVFNTIIANLNPYHSSTIIPLSVSPDHNTTSMDVSYSCLFNTTMPDNPHINVDENSLLYQDPVWINDEYYLGEGSPCINAGRPGPLDPDNTFPDIGKHWFNTNNDVDDPVSVKPDRFSLSRAWPNPFNGATRASLTLPQASPLTVQVVDVLGRTVETLYRGVHAAGEMQLHWVPKDAAAGVYFLRATTPMHSQAMKLVYTK